MTCVRDEMVPFAEVARLVGMQTQYASRYHTGVGGTPVLTAGLQVTDLGPGGDYHALRVHRDDVQELADRILRDQADD